MSEYGSSLTQVCPYKKRIVHGEIRGREILYSDIFYAVTRLGYQPWIKKSIWGNFLRTQQKIYQILSAVSKFC